MTGSIQLLTQQKQTLSHNTPTLRLQELNKTNQRTICMKYTETPLTDTSPKLDKSNEKIPKNLSESEHETSPQKFFITSSEKQF